VTFTEDLIEFCKEEVTLYKSELVSANAEDVYKIEQKMAMLKDVISLSKEYDYNESTRFSFDAINTIIRGIRKVKQSHTTDIMSTKINIFKDDILFFGQR
jgi:hypothetical protein